MRFTLLGFNQIKLMEFDMDYLDAVILREFIDFKDSGKMVHEEIDGDVYYWVKYDGIREELPILDFKKDTIYRRFKKMVKAGVLKHKTIREYGTYSYYALGEKFSELVKGVKENHRVKTHEEKQEENVHLQENETNPQGGEEISEAVDLEPNGRGGNTPDEDDNSEESPVYRDEKTEGVGNKILGVEDSNPEQKTHLLNNSSFNISLKNKNNNNKSNYHNVSVYDAFEKYDFGRVNQWVKEMLDEDIKVYGCEWIIDAMKEAARRNRYNLSYVEGILKNWRCSGKSARKIPGGGDVNGFDWGNSREAGAMPEMEESLRLRRLAGEIGLISAGAVYDIECDF